MLSWPGWSSASLSRPGVHDRAGSKGRAKKDCSADTPDAEKKTVAINPFRDAVSMTASMLCFLIHHA